ncbi:DUF255 domain-containing protein [Sulfurovum sp.]|uniref:DUF255 domain-containing protein n=1 Tax=Sulfurovum sp. TaxID=1969726 RepID=UPI00286836DB|nr:DUF255 domain-containing protein [Sulfurovum sp.]
MKKMAPLLALFCLCMFQGHAEQSVKPFQETISKSPEEEMLGTFGKLKWETEMDYAFERAKKEHKNVMIMVEEPQCKWCVKMKKGALSDKDVQVKLQAYVLLKVRRSDRDTIKQIEGFTSAIPSFHFMYPNKETIETVIGYFETEDFLGYLCEIETDN